MVLVSVSSQRVFWGTVMVGDEDVSDDIVAEAVLVLDCLAAVVDDGDVADTTVVGAIWVVDWFAVVVDVDVEDVTGAVVSDCVRRLLVVVVEDVAAVPKTLSSAALVQGWPFISDTATRRTYRPVLAVKRTVFSLVSAARVPVATAEPQVVPSELT